MKKLSVEDMEKVKGGGCGATMLGAFLIGFFAGGGLLTGTIAAGIAGLACEAQND